MSIKKAFREHLINDIDVGVLVASRIYPDHAPTNADRPYIVLTQVPTTSRERLLSGPSKLATSTIQVEVYDDHAAAAEELATAVRLSVDGLKGFMGDQAVNIRGAFVTGPDGSFSKPVDGSQVGAHVEVLEVEFHYYEEVPHRPVQHVGA